MTEDVLITLRDVQIPQISISKDDLAGLPVRKRVGVIASKFAESAKSRDFGGTSYTAFASALVTASTTVVESIIPGKSVKLYTSMVRRCFSLLGMLPLVNNMLSVTSSRSEADTETGVDFDRAFMYAGVRQFDFKCWGPCFESSDVSERFLYENFTRFNRADVGADSLESWEDPVKVHVGVGTLNNFKYTIYCAARASSFNKDIVFYTTKVYSQVSEAHAQEVYEVYTKKALSIFRAQLDPMSSYLVCNRNGFTVVKKPQFEDIEIVNLPGEKLLDKIKSALAQNMKWSLMIVGDPGQGKSTTIYEFMHQLPDVVFIWLRPDHLLNNADYTYSVIRSIGPCVLVFDDIEQCDIADKNSENLAIFQTMFDDNSPLKCVIISTANEPQLIHPSLRRARRLGDLALFANSPTCDAILKIVNRHHVRPKLTDGQVTRIARDMSKESLTIADVATVLGDIADSEVTDEIITECIKQRLDARTILSMKVVGGVLQKSSKSKTSKDSRNGDTPIATPVRRPKI